MGRIEDRRMLRTFFPVILLRQPSIEFKIGQSDVT